MLQLELSEDLWLKIFGKLYHWEIAQYCMPISKGWYQMGLEATGKSITFREKMKLYQRWRKNLDDKLLSEDITSLLAYIKARRCRLEALTLHLYNFPQDLLERLNSALEECEALRTVEFINSKGLAQMCRDEPIVDFSILKGLPGHIHYLNCEFMTFTDRSITNLFQLTALKRLELQIAKNWDTSKAFFDEIFSLAQLEHLSVGFVHNTKCISGLLKLTKLAFLGLSGLPRLDQRLILCIKEMPKLRSVSLEAEAIEENSDLSLLARHAALPEISIRLERCCRLDFLSVMALPNLGFFGVHQSLNEPTACLTSVSWQAASLQRLKIRHPDLDIRLDLEDLFVAPKLIHVWIEFRKIQFKNLQTVSKEAVCRQKARFSKRWGGTYLASLSGFEERDKQLLTALKFKVERCEKDRPPAELAYIEA